MIATDPEIVYAPWTVDEWRRHELVAAGVAVSVAYALARTEADLHVMLTAKAQGCPDDLLARIFRGIE